MSGSLVLGYGKAKINRNDHRIGKLGDWKIEKLIKI